MASTSIRYDISLSARLLRAIPVVAAYVLLVVAVYITLPEPARKLPLHSVLLVGFIGLFRYAWVMTHCVRAAIYEHYLYPKLRFEADQLPDEQKMPKRIFFIIPTFGEKPEVSARMLDSVLDEAQRVPSQCIIVINAGSERDDDIFRDIVAARPALPNVDVRYVRQIGGKRQGMADALWTLMDEPVDDNDALVLMDGDTVLGTGILEKCLPLFASNPKLGALTTDNISVTNGNWLYRKFYTLRFSMRHRMMKSQSLSRQLLVLTGRFSVFRARECLTHDFVTFLENDRIKHWLHGEIKFVTGDDKSTWYCLLNRGCEMLYVPDAHIYCMEDSGSRPFVQSIKKMHRWFGNMLRNNGRAIALGPGRQKLFIWLCLVDQRISMFTSLMGPVAALWISFCYSFYYLIAYLMIVIVTRLVYALVLVIEGHRLSLVDLPMLLYTQWVGSLVKIYTMFHLHEQRWDAHREGGGDKAVAAGGSAIDRMIPKLQMALAYTVLALVVTSIVGLKR